MVAQQLARPEIVQAFRPGMEVAITAGSRGIANIALIIKSIVQVTKNMGLRPFVVPAMGSHGGATAQGQRQVIESYGITEDYIGCEIRSSMETVEISRTPNGKPVLIDKNAYQADGIIVCGRVKPHTAYRGPYESGIMKMMAIGLGKQAGADIIHADSFKYFKEYIPMFGKEILKHAPIKCGIALLENAYDQTCEIVSLTPQEIVDQEPVLLKRAYSYMPRIMFESCDVLVVDKMGKDISGDGMDPNITGHFPTPYASGGIQSQRLVVLGLTEASHGNAYGVGFADCTTRRLFEQMDLEQTYPNSVTNTLTGGVKIPMILNSDKLAIQMALKSCNEIDTKAPRIVHISTTLNMQEMEISEAMLKSAMENPNIEILGEARPFAFDEHDNLW